MYQGNNYDEITLIVDKTNVPFNKNLSGNMLTIDPVADFVYGKKYTVTIPAAAVQDLSGNPLASKIKLNFRDRHL